MGVCNSAPTHVLVKAITQGFLIWPSVAPQGVLVSFAAPLRWSEVPGLLLEFRGDLKFNSSASGTKETAYHVTSGNSALLGLVRGNKSQVEKVEGAEVQIHP